MRIMVFTIIQLILSGSLLAQSRIVIFNPANQALKDAVVEVPWATVLQAYPQVDTSQLQVELTGTGQQVPCQLERRGEKRIQNLLVQISIGAGQSVSILVKKGEPRPTPAKTYCRYVPERYDDFAWENDLVAFRIYGAALNGRTDNAYGSDFWAKRTSKLIINNWYKQNDYHVDHGEGLDYYQVGLTLGAGDIGIFLNDSIQFIHNYRSYQILDNGPLRSTFRVTFDPQTINGIVVKEERTVSLDAGSQLSKVQVRMDHSAPGALPVVVGVTLRAEESPLMLDEKDGVLGYWEPKHGKDGIIGIGCVFVSPSVSMFRKYEHGLARLSVISGETLTYFAGGAWDKAGRITNSDAWFEYLGLYAKRVKTPIVIHVK